MQLLRRNAEELLEWHEHFVMMLERAVLPVGLGWVFAQASERRGREARQSGEDMAAQSVDEAVNVVMDLFAQEVSPDSCAYMQLTQLGWTPGLFL